MKKYDLSENSISKLIICMSIPSILAMIIQALYNLVDMYFVSQISETALTVVSLSYPLQTAVFAFAGGSGVGVGVYVAKKLGERNITDANNIIAHGVIITLSISALFAIIGIFLVKPFLCLYTNNDDIILLGLNYLPIICIGAFTVIFQILFEKIIQGCGNTILPMIAEFLNGIIHVFVSPMLIFGYGIIPAMGITGIAISTVAGQSIAMLFLFSFLISKKFEVKLNIKCFNPNSRIFKNIFIVAIPVTITQMTSSIMSIFMNKILIRISYTFVAVYGIYSKLSSFFLLPISGLSDGSRPIMSFNYGAKNKQRLIKTLKLSILYAFCISFIITSLFMIFPAEILSVFKPSEEMIVVGTNALRIISLSFILAGFVSISSTFFQSMGNGLYSLVTAIIRRLAVLLPVAYLLSNLDISDIWFAFIIAEFVATFFSVLFIRYLYKTKIKLL